MQIVPNPGDGIVQALAERFDKSVGITKNWFDCLNLSITLCISLIVLIIEVLFKIKGVVGLILCLASVYFVIGLIIKLLRVAEIIDDNLLEKIDILFFL